MLKTEKIEKTKETFPRLMSGGANGHVYLITAKNGYGWKGTRVYSSMADIPVGIWSDYWAGLEEFNGRVTLENE